MNRKYFLTSVCLFFLCISHPLSHGDTLSYRQQINLIDSMTGYAVCPDNMIIRDTARGLIIYQGEEEGKKESTKGSMLVSLPYGSYDYVFEAAGYRSMAVNFTVNNKSPRIISVYLDPLETPPELNPEFIASLHRPDATVIIGFVVDDNNGMPIADVQVGQNGDNSCTKTNDRGFFILNMPFPPYYEGIPVADIGFQKEGYRTELRKYVELMPNTDWVYRIRLKRGKGKKVIDERAYRRRDIKNGFKEDVHVQDENEATQNTEGDMQQKICRENQETPLMTIPHTIRVGTNCSSSTSCTSVAVYSLDTYVKYVLPAEWYSCWGALANGMDSLKAGAVAIRSYGVYYVRNPIDVYHYDICDTTSCQVLGNVQSTTANNAVDQTSGYVLAN
ncbi:MAG: SpoIID/LytB domain-containing protein, partial [Candidatus Brocadiaceae bacterium]